MLWPATGGDDDAEFDDRHGGFGSNGAPAAGVPLLGQLAATTDGAGSIHGFDYSVIRLNLDKGLGVSNCRHRLKRRQSREIVIMPGSLANRLARRLGGMVRVRPAQIACSGGAVSFSFDDFPKSALHTGGAILEKYGLRGTYYAALGLAGSNGDVGPMAELEDIRAAYDRGHELGCHTYSHLDCSRAADSVILEDIRRNAEAFSALLDGFRPSSFAYPFGRHLLSARHLLAPRFGSCRGITGGANHGTVDLSNLRATRIYGRTFDEHAFRELIDRNRAVGGWIVFYTHDVAALPSPYGCTPRQFETVVAYAVERTTVLPLGQVIAGVSRDAA